MMKVLMVFMPSVAISALVVEDGLRVIQGVAELMICRLCMFLMQVQSRASWGPKGVGFLPVGDVEISLTCTTNHA
jgi:hypothetical protein